MIHDVSLFRKQYKKVRETTSGVPGLPKLLTTYMQLISQALPDLQTFSALFRKNRPRKRLTPTRRTSETFLILSPQKSTGNIQRLVQ